MSTAKPVTDELNRLVPEPEPNKLVSVGTYLGKRLEEVGLGSFFTVPGDFTLALLDDLIKIPSLRMIGCCNELNAGYAADGYARATGGLGVAIVTYCVGGLSIINAAAGAYSDSLPLLVISGGVNTHDSQDRHIVHHTIGEFDLYQSAAAFKPVVYSSLVIKHVNDAASMIDEAIFSALTQKKPVYLEIAVNLIKAKIPEPSPMQFKVPRQNDSLALAAAVEDIINRISLSVKPVAVAGVKIRPAEAQSQVLRFVEALELGVALMPDAKSLFPEFHPQYMGVYWAGISSMHVSEVVESADLLLGIGSVFNDYTTTGWTALLNPAKIISIQPHYVDVAGKRYSGVNMVDLLEALTARVPSKNASLQAFQRYHDNSGQLVPAPPAEPDQPLTLREFRRQLQASLTSNTSLIAETGDSWFIGQYTKLPDGATFHIQMQYGSIGWAVGATLGVALAVGEERRVVALIGDGSFQVTAQEVSTMIRQNVKATIFLMNNRGYTIEVEIHDGPYNDTKNWDYAGLINVFNAGEGNGIGIKARNGRELAAAIEAADRHNGLTLIECQIGRDDCTSELLLWGSRVASATMRP